MAIEHAISFIRLVGITLPKYFELLHSQRLQVLSEKVTLNQSGIKISIFKSFLLTIQKLQTEDPEAFKLLSVFGILDGSFIHEPFAQNLCQTEWQYTKIKRLLLEFSMIKCNQHISELDIIKYLTIHSLYQQAVIYILYHQKMITEIVQLCVRMNPFKIPQIIKGEEYWEKINKELIQLVYLLKQPLLQSHINPLTARIFTVFGHSLLEDRALHKEAWVAKLLGTHLSIQVHKKVKFS